MRKKIICLITIVTVFFGAGSFASKVLSQSNPLSLKQILKAIDSINQASVKDKKKLSDKVFNDISQRRVDFSLTKENEEFLRSAGATDEFIEVIRKNSPPLIIATSTPNLATPSPTPLPIPAPKPAYSVFLDNGDKYFKEFDFGKAIEQYTKVLEIDPQNINALIQRGYSHHYKGDLNNDFADYSNAIRLNPKLSSEPRIICVLSAPSKNSFGEAIESCNKAISENPNFSLLYYKRGNAYRQKGESIKAIKDYDAAINLFPEFYGAFLNRAYVKTSSDPQEALNDFGKAISISPSTVSGYIGRLSIYLANEYLAYKYLDKALADINKAIELEPKSASIYIQRGQIYLYSNRYNRKDIDKEKFYGQAEASFGKAIELDSKNAEAYLKRGEQYFYRGMLNNSLGTNGQSFRKNNNEIDQKYFDLAKSDFDNAVQIKSEYSVQVAFFYLSIGKINKSPLEITKAIELDPNFDAYFQRGLLYEEKKDYDKAIEDFSKSIEISPNKTYTFAQRGSCYFKIQNYDLALNDYNKAIELFPVNGLAYQGRADVYEKIGKKDLAQQDRKIADTFKKR